MPEAEPSILGSVGAPPSVRADPGPRERSARERPAARRGDAPTVFVAGFWRRAAAAAIDAAIIVPISALLAWIASAIAGIRLPPGKTSQPDFWLDLVLASDPAIVTALVIALAVASIYLFVFQAILGQTLGMRVLRLRVIDLYGEPPSYLRAGVRTAGYLAGFFTLFLGFLWIGFDAEKRGLHDWIAGTYVVHAS